MGCRDDGHGAFRCCHGWRAAAHSVGERRRVVSAGRRLLARGLEQKLHTAAAAEHLGFAAVRPFAPARRPAPKPVNAARVGRARRPQTAVRVGVAVALIIVAVAAVKAGLFGLDDMAKVRELIDRVRAIKALKLLFVIAYACLAAIGVPASPLTLAG